MSRSTHLISWLQKIESSDWLILILLSLLIGQLWKRRRRATEWEWRQFRPSNIFVQIVNVFVKITKCICHNYKMYLSKLQNVFLQIVKCILIGQKGIIGRGEEEGRRSGSGCRQFRPSDCRGQIRQPTNLC